MELTVKLKEKVQMNLIIHKISSPNLNLNMIYRQIAIT